MTTTELTEQLNTMENSMIRNNDGFLTSFTLGNLNVRIWPQIDDFDIQNKSKSLFINYKCKQVSMIWYKDYVLHILCKDRASAEISTLGL